MNMFFQWLSTVFKLLFPRKLKDNIKGVINLSVVIMIGICFAALMVVAYIIFTIRDNLLPEAYPGNSAGATDAANASWNASYRSASTSIGNITSGFDNAVALLLVAITIFILALAVAALLMLRGR